MATTLDLDALVHALPELFADYELVELAFGTLVVQGVEWRLHETVHGDFCIQRRRDAAREEYATIEAKISEVIRMVRDSGLPYRHVDHWGDYVEVKARRR